MSGNIETLLAQIQSAVYGNEVRGSIHDAIEECYEDVSASKTLADTSVAACNTATNQATSAANNANAKAVLANTAAQNADASTAQCNSVVTALPQTIASLFSSLGLTIVDGKLCVEVIRDE